MPIPTQGDHQAGGPRVHEEYEPAGCGPDRLTNLLTRPCGTGETAWDVGDSHCPASLVSETRRKAGDGGDVRRGAHNPATTGLEFRQSESVFVAQELALGG